MDHQHHHHVQVRDIERIVAHNTYTKKKKKSKYIKISSSKLCGRCHVSFAAARIIF
jgi:hypothetical protein